ncbi:MAG: hypothetical protein IPK12_22985 [Gemmatimonadetes bacterium]|nr:hypothetical protein [Gemmatimonadota bacterium]
MLDTLQQSATNVPLSIGVGALGACLLARTVIDWAWSRRPVSPPQPVVPAPEVTERDPWLHDGFALW